MIIMTIINTFWVEMTINGWVEHERKMARSFGANELSKTDSSLKRVLF
jgi:hypothetical protein